MQIIITTETVDTEKLEGREKQIYEAGYLHGAEAYEKARGSRLSIGIAGCVLFAITLFYHISKL